jgi:uroporphyrinogen decarboxylase
VFEYAWNLVGLEKFLIDLSYGADYVEPLLDQVMHFNIEVARTLIGLGVDVILTGDDFGTQGGMLISPRLWRHYFKGRMRQVFDACRQANPEVILAYHSCGSIAPIIPELIEIGLQALNPIQPKAKDMEPARLKAQYGDRLAFFGGVDIQEVVPFGTVQDVREEVRRRIYELGNDGGYLLAPAHDIQPEAPTANVLAIFDAVREYGQYPLPEVAQWQN